MDSGRLFGTDLVLLHPPSVYDFRKNLSEYGPISDVIFSSPAYDAEATLSPDGRTALELVDATEGIEAVILDRAVGPA